MCECSCALTVSHLRLTIKRLCKRSCHWLSHLRHTPSTASCISPLERQVCFNDKGWGTVDSLFQQSALTLGSLFVLETFQNGFFKRGTEALSRNKQKQADVMHKNPAVMRLVRQMAHLTQLPQTFKADLWRLVWFSRLILEREDRFVLTGSIKRASRWGLGVCGGHKRWHLRPTHAVLCLLGDEKLYSVMVGFS